MDSLKEIASSHVVVPDSGWLLPLPHNLLTSNRGVPNRPAARGHKDRHMSCMSSTGVGPHPTSHSVFTHLYKECIIVGIRPQMARVRAYLGARSGLSRVKVESRARIRNQSWPETSLCWSRLTA